MHDWLKRIRVPALLLAGLAAGWNGKGIPVIGALLDWLAEIDYWISARAEYPFIFAAFVGAAVSYAAFLIATRKKRIMRDLAFLRTRGVEIRNRGEQLDGAMTAEWSAWCVEASGWSAEVVAVMSKIDEGQAEWFNTLDVVRSSRVLGRPSSADAAALWHHHDARLIRLENILTKHYSGIEGAVWGNG